MAGTASKDSDLRRAIRTGEADTVRQLVADGADVDALDSDDNPLLHGAIQQNGTEVVQTLVNAGADVNVRSESSQPLLSVAITLGTWKYSSTPGPNSNFEAHAG